MTDILKGWYCDHSPGRGKIIIGSGSGGGGGGGGGFYVEMTLSNANASHHVLLGLCTSGFNATQTFSGFSLSAGAYAALTDGFFLVFAGGATAGGRWGDEVVPATAPSATVGDVIGMAFSTANKLAWWRNATTAPNTWFGAGTGGGSPDPATLNRGLDFSALTGPYYVLGGVGSDNFGTLIMPQGVYNFGATAFTAAAPLTYGVFDATSGFDAAHTGDQITLTGSPAVVATGPTFITPGSNEPAQFTRSTTSK